jgi:hypothetical protein
MKTRRRGRPDVRSRHQHEWSSHPRRAEWNSRTRTHFPASMRMLFSASAFLFDLSTTTSDPSAGLS